jgi:hypothetical protein
MSETLPHGAPKLELPPRQAFGLAERPKASGKASALVIVLLLAVIGLQAAALFRPAPAAPSPEGAASSAPARVSDLPLKDIAARLQRSNLPGAAVKALEEHLAALPLEKRDERRQTLVTMATLLMKARRHEEAIVRLFEAEELGPDAETKNFIDRQVSECFQKLGKHDELAYQLADRASAVKPGAPSPGQEAASREVASIGIESITASDLDALVAQDVDRQLFSLPLEEKDKESYRAQLLKEFQAPQRRLQKLQQLVARKVLYREGMERELDKSPAVQAQIDELREGLIAQQVVVDELEARIKISENDLRLFYEAKKEAYRQKASARARIAVLPDLASASEALAQVKSEDDFKALAAERSLDPSTKAKGGLLDDPIVDGRPCPVLGDAPALVEAVLAADPGKPIAAAVPLAQGAAIAFVVEKKPARLPEFQELREQVARDYSQAKQLEVQSQLIEELFKKHAVNIRTDAFIRAEEAESGGKEPAKDAKGGAAPDDAKKL